MCVLVLGGCKTSASVLVTVKPNGSGTVVVEVHLDRAAAEQVGDVSKLLAVDDLKRAGWKIAGPGWPPDVNESLHRPAQKQGVQRGSVLVYLEHDFTDVDEANEILATLSGPDGPYKGVRVERSSSSSRTTLRVTGNVDLSKGLDTFGDAALTRALGAPLSQVVARSGGVVPEGDDLVVALGVETEPEQPWNGAAADRGVSPGFVTTSASLGEKGKPIDVTTSWTHRGRIVLVALGVALLGLVVAVVVVVAVRRRRRV